MRQPQRFGPVRVELDGHLALPSEVRDGLGLVPGMQIWLSRDPDDTGLGTVITSGLEVDDASVTPPRNRWSYQEHASHEMEADQGDIATMLRTVDLYRDLDENARKRVASFTRREVHLKGEIIVREGAPCEAIYSVIQGSVKRYKLSAHGRELALRILGPGNSFNALSILDDGPNAAWAQALDRTSLYVLRRDDLLLLMDENPQIRSALLRITGRRIRDVLDILEDLSTRNVPARVAHFLLKQPETTIRLTQQELAALTGTARETIGRTLHQMKELGAVRVEKGRIVILQPDLLQRLI